MTSITNFLATKNSINFYSNKAFDLSSFGSFSFLKIPKFNFYSTTYSSYVLKKATYIDNAH
jgi:hypothetical protein